MRRWVLPLVLAVGLSPMAAAGCGNDAVGVAACKQIEEARCNAASKCNAITIPPPYYSSGSATDACIRFYDTACLHGLAGNQPMAGQLQACVGAIQDGGCSVVETPWSNSACSWLIPPSTPEASVEAEAEAGDAADADATDDGTTE